MSPSQHRLPTRTYRPDPEEYADAAELLGPGETMDRLVRACLRAFAADPARFRALIAKHWPPPARQGRPPREDAP